MAAVEFPRWVEILKGVSKTSSRVTEDFTFWMEEIGSPEAEKSVGERGHLISPAFYATRQYLSLLIKMKTHFELSTPSWKSFCVLSLTLLRRFLLWIIYETRKCEFLFYFHPLLSPDGFLFKTHWTEGEKLQWEKGNNNCHTRTGEFFFHNFPLSLKILFDFLHFFSQLKTKTNLIYRKKSFFDVLAEMLCFSNETQR